ncbi:MAG: MBL fold metallo-hydrolase [Planctomycetes bacterium]|nr:MBL fold metallo-hydrolase [Planctomycetota bacterium]
MGGKSILRGVRISEKLYLLNGLGIVGLPLPACYTYAIDTGDGLVVVDPGLRETFPRVKDNLRRLGLADKGVSKVFVTHVHGDHLFAAKDFAADGARVFASSWSAALINADIANGFRENPEYVKSEVGEFPYIEACADGQIISVGDSTIEIISTPGHSPGCISLYLTTGGRRVLFVGDLIFPDGTVGHVGAHSFSFENILMSLRKISSLDVDILCGGHFYKDTRANSIIKNTLKRAELHYAEVMNEG